ncbi:MAG: abortive infection family protein [Nitrospirae bacterium]|nr:abortive infection family protein [Nitrospirota bacterium]
MEFDAAHIACDRQYDPQLSGQRRRFVEQHYHTLDFTNPDDVHRLLSAYENILNTATRKLPTQYDKAATERAIENLVACLKKDGFKYQDGKLTSSIPETRRVFDEARSDNNISEITRRNILDKIRIDNTAWSGRLSEIDFLSRLYDLENLPSSDHRFETAKGDIFQHRVNNDDWLNDWVFSDSRFDLIRSPDKVFLRFLCEMIHPVVRPSSQDVEKILADFNQCLVADGWEIYAERTRISNMPVFAARPLMVKGNSALKAVALLIVELNAEYMTQQITRMETAIESDPELAIGTAKEFVETICKTILREHEETIPNGVTLPQLVKQVCKKLSLLPADIPDKAKGAENIKRILSNLGSVAQGLAELRSLYGSGHGKDAKFKGLKSRHARLAVGAASTLAVFLFDTYQARKATTNYDDMRKR